MSRNQKSKKKKTKWKNAIVNKKGHLTTSEVEKDTIPKPRKSRIKRFLKVIWNIVGALGVIISIWIAVTPRISVYPSVRPDPNDPTFTAFVVSNQGYLPIYDVKVSCAIKDIEFITGQHLMGKSNYKSRLQSSKHVANVIRAGEDYAEFVALASLSLSPIKKGDMAIVVTFRPIKWIPWRREKSHRFVVKGGKDGTRYWLPQPIDK